MNINFNFLNDCLNDIRQFHTDYVKLEKELHQIMSDIKSLFVIIVIGQDDVNYL
jgi:hypothetical protein